MFPLRFDLTEAVNLAIAGVVTLVTVLLGASIAFRYGLRHLRHERALDRKLELLESLHETFQEYIAKSRVLLRQDTEALHQPDAWDAVQRASLVKEVAAESNRLLGLFRRVELYGDSKLGAWTWSTTTPFVDLVLQSSPKAANYEAEVRRLKSFEEAIGKLAKEAEEIRRRIRVELGLDRPT